MTIERSVGCLLLFLWMLHGTSVAQPSGPRNDAAVDKAIERAQAYLLTQGEKLDLQSIFLYQYVQRKFNLDPISTEKLKEQVNQQHLFYPFMRVVPGVEPVVDSTIFEKAGSRIDRMTLQALYCDRFPVDESYLDSLLLASEGGKYALTHALFSIILLDQNGCLKKLKGHKMITEQIANAVADLVRNSDFKDDIAIEGMCFLYDGGWKDKVDPSWVHVMVGHQGADGGFFRTVKNSMTNAKTTVLALWCMLEYKTNGARSEPWVKD